MLPLFHAVLPLLWCMQVAAAKAEAALGQAKIVEQAREVEEQQSVDKAATSIMDMLGLSPADLGL